MDACSIAERSMNRRIVRSSATDRSSSGGARRDTSNFQRLQPDPSVMRGALPTLDTRVQNAYVPDQPHGQTKRATKTKNCNVRGRAQEGDSCRGAVDYHLNGLRDRSSMSGSYTATRLHVADTARFQFPHRRYAFHRSPTCCRIIPMIPAASVMSARSSASASPSVRDWPARVSAAIT